MIQTASSHRPRHIPANPYIVCLHVLRNLPTVLWFLVTKVMGFLPRFSNPHFVQQSTQIVSRADLEAEHDVSHEDAEDDDNDVLQALENILKRSLGDFHVGQADPESDGGRDKKRRKKSKTKDSEETQSQVMQTGDGADDEVVGACPVLATPRRMLRPR